MRERRESTMRWAVQWRTRNRLDGVSSYFIWDQEGNSPRLFGTHAAASLWIRKEYGHLATRTDLRKEPYGWRMPRPVRVRVELIAVVS